MLGYPRFIGGGFPHSEIPGLKVAYHLPETYRRLVTSFLGVFRQGIHCLPYWTLIFTTHSLQFLKCKSTYTGGPEGTRTPDLRYAKAAL